MAAPSALNRGVRGTRIAVRGVMKPLRSSILLATLALVAPACGTEDDGLARASRGGYCCPIMDTQTCNCFPNGGWTASSDPTTCPSICDLAPVNTRIEIDAHGCEVLVGPQSCLGAGDLEETSTAAPL